MNQLRLFPPSAAPKQPLSNKVLKEVRDLVIELLIAVITANSEKHQPEEEIDE